MISIGSGLEEIIDQNLNAPSVIDLITSPSIYIPLIAFHLNQVWLTNNYDFF